MKSLILLFITFSSFGFVYGSGIMDRGPDTGYSIDIIDTVSIDTVDILDVPLFVLSGIISSNVHESLNATVMVSIGKKWVWHRSYTTTLMANRLTDIDIDYDQLE
jgi:hypothetical protein